MTLTDVVARTALKGLIQAYRWFVSPVLGVNCRFAPSCSEYALEAVSQHGALRGSALAAWRLCRCHPWGGDGFDPVPPARPATAPSSFETAASGALLRMRATANASFDRLILRSAPRGARLEGRGDRRAAPAAPQRRANFSCDSVR